MIEIDFPGAPTTSPWRLDFDRHPRGIDSTPRELISIFPKVARESNPDA
jgi:hypothetical protein